MSLPIRAKHVPIIADKKVLSEAEKKTQEYDKLAFKLVGYAAIPVMTGYTIYSSEWKEAERIIGCLILLGLAIDIVLYLWALERLASLIFVADASETFVARTRDGIRSSSRLWRKLYICVSVLFGLSTNWIERLMETISRFGFAQLIPQLIINYKLKSVAHMP